MNQIQATPPIPAASSAPVAKGQENPGITFRQTYQQAQQNTTAADQEKDLSQDTPASSTKKQEEVSPNLSETSDRTTAETAILLAMSGMFQPMGAFVPEKSVPTTNAASASFQAPALAGIGQASVAHVDIVAKPEAESVPTVQGQVDIAPTEQPQAQKSELPAFADRLTQEKTQAIIQEVLPEKQPEPVRTSAREHTVTLQELLAKNRATVSADDRFDSMVQEAQQKLVSRATPKAEARISASLNQQDTSTQATAEEEADIQLAGAMIRETPAATTAQTFAAKTKEVPVFEQVSRELVENLRQGTTSFQMRLQPHELGEVTVRMELREGKLSVHVTAETPAARSLLERQMAHLAASLKSTVEVEQVQVTPSQSSPDSGSTPFEMNSGSHPQQQQQAFSGKAQGPAMEAIQTETQPALSEAASLLDRAV